MDSTETRAEKVPCMLCGKLCVSVGKHAQMLHGVTADEYRMRFPGAVMTGAAHHAAYAKRMGEKSRELWKSAEYQKLREGYSSRLMVQLWTRPEYRLSRTESARVSISKLNEDPEFNRRRLEARWGTKAHRRAQAIVGRSVMNKLNESPEFREKSRGAQNFQVEHRGVKMRSTWERDFARFLDVFGVPYLYEPQSFRMPNGKLYIPDFWLTESRRFVEVKPTSMIDALVLYKIDFMSTRYPLILIQDTEIDEIRLFLKGVT